MESGVGAGVMSRNHKLSVPIKKKKILASFKKKYVVPKVYKMSDNKVL